MANDKWGQAPGFELLHQVMNQTCTKLKTNTLPQLNSLVCYIMGVTVENVHIMYILMVSAYLQNYIKVAGSITIL